MTPTQALLLLGVPAALCQTSTVTVVPTPQPWDGALSRCLELGYSIYPVPATPTDPVYAALQAQPGDRYWIRRRRGGSCTCLNKNGSDNLVEEAPCGDLLPAICKDCSHGGDGC